MTLDEYTCDTIDMTVSGVRDVGTGGTGGIYRGAHLNFVWGA